MFRFENIEYLYFIGLIPILILIYFLGLWINKRNISKFGSADLVKRLMPNFSLAKQHIKFVLYILGLIMFCFAYANPQWGFKKAKVKAKSTDVFIAMDISQSMMAEDISPNRLERAKRFTTKLLKKLRSEKVGLIFFAGNAYLQVPVTHDVASVEMFVKSANTAQAGTQGTAIAQAIALCEESFDIDEDRKNYKKALIVITDGENHEQEVINAAKKAKENGIIVYTVGVGTEAGDYVMVNTRGYKEVKKDIDGNPVRSSLNVQMIKDLAEAGGGLSYLINDEKQVIDGISNDLSKLEKKESEQQAFSDYNSYFQYFLFLSFIFLLIELLVSNVKNRTSLTERLFGKNA